MMDNLKLYDLIQITARLEPPSPSLMSTLVATPQSYITYNRQQPLTLTLTWAGQSYITYNIHNMLAVNRTATPYPHISWPVFCQLE